MPRTIDPAIVTESQLSKNNPIFLLEIYLTGITLRYTNNDVDIVFPTAGNTYTSIGFTFDPVKNSITGSVDSSIFKFDNTDLVSGGYVLNYEFQGHIIILKRVFGNKLTSADYATITFAGEMRNPSVNEEEVEIEAVSPLYRFQEQIPRRNYQGLCPWKFDSAECRGCLTEGDDFNMNTVGNWLQQGSTTLTGGYGTIDERHEYVLRIQFDAINEGAYLDQTFFTTPLIVGQTYTVEFDYKYINNTNITSARVTLGGATDDLDYTKTEWSKYSGSFVALVNQDLIIYGSLAGSDASNELLIDNVIIIHEGGISLLLGELTGQTADAGSTASVLIDAARTEADDYWNNGNVEMTSGDNIGLKRRILDFTDATDTITFVFAFPNVIAPGDTYTIKRGCNKTEQQCEKVFSNFANFGGFTSIPESEVI
ncbi:MAG: phage BR0599 family protein [Bacteroidota bacterium]